MEFTQEFIESNGFNEEQANLLNDHLKTEIVPEIKKGYDGVANKNSEGILTGASKYASEKFGISLEREQGEKWGDYLFKITDKAFESKQAEIKQKEQELQEKLTNFKGSDELREKYEKSLEELDKYKQTVAELEPLKGLDEKYKQATDKLTTMQREVAYGSVKPNFPENVNIYEADAKWNEWKNGVEEKYNIELIEGKPFAIDKDNEHKKIELSKLIAEDENISNLLKGRQQKGNGAIPTNLVEVEGLPFKLPKDASKEEITKIVREHTLKEFPNIASKEYKNRFSELYIKATKK